MSLVYEGGLVLGGALSAAARQGLGVYHKTVAALKSMHPGMPIRKLYADMKASTGLTGEALLSHVMSGKMGRSSPGRVRVAITKRASPGRVRVAVTKRTSPTRARVAVTKRTSPARARMTGKSHVTRLTVAERRRLAALLKKGEHKCGACGGDWKDILGTLLPLGLSFL